MIFTRFTTPAVLQSLLIIFEKAAPYYHTILEKRQNGHRPEISQNARQTFPEKVETPQDF